MQDVKSQLQQQNYKIRLCEVRGKILLAKGFIEQGITKSMVDENIEKARANLDSTKESEQLIFYKDDNTKVLRTTQSTGAYLELSKYLQMKIAMHEFSDDLEEDLNKLAREELSLLEIISKNPDVLNKSKNTP